MFSELYPFFAFIHHLDEPFAFIFLIAVLSLILGWMRRSYALGFFVSIAATFVVTNMLKNIFAVPRPEDMVLVANGYRFPSMHAAITGAITGSFWYYFMRTVKGRAPRALMTLLLVTILAVVGVSRVMLNVHEPIDVVIGSIIGVILSYHINHFITLRSEEK